MCWSRKEAKKSFDNLDNKSIAAERLEYVTEKILNCVVI
jgi:hypothetical protein